MNKIEAYTRAKSAAAQAQRWYDMVGKTYYGGTRGAGETGRIVKAGANYTVYYQHSDGDKNYHESPDALDAALAVVITRHHKELIEEALHDLKQAEKKAAEEAVAEHALLMKAAGIVPDGEWQSDVAAAAGGLTQVAIER